MGIVRRCRICSCRSDEVSFVKMKDSKSGKYYTHNICRPCRVEENHKSRIKRRNRDPKHDSRVTMAWRKRNIKKWRKYHNEYCKRQRAKKIDKYLLGVAF